MNNPIFRAIWSNQDIMDYFKVGKTKASQISQLAKIQYNGIVTIDNKKVYRDAVFKVFGLDAKEELRRLMYE